VCAEQCIASRRSPCGQPAAGYLRLRLRFLREPVAADEADILSGPEDESVVVAQPEACRCAVQCSEARQQGVLQRTGGGCRATRGCQFPAEDFASAAVDHRCEHGMAVAAAGHVGEVGGPSFVRALGDGHALFGARAPANGAVPQRPVLQSHDAADLLAVHDETAAARQLDMDTSHAERRALFDDLPDLSGDRFIDGLAAFPRTRLVVERGARHVEQSAELRPGQDATFGMKLLSDGVHQIPSGKSLPSKRCAFFKTSTCTVSSPTFASSLWRSASCCSARSRG
jgi:hypothetical protein